MVWFREAKTHYNNFLEKTECDENTIYVLDKGYNDYKAYEHFTIQKTGFVIRIKVNASYLSIEKLDIGEWIHDGVLEDEIIKIDVKKAKK